MSEASRVVERSDLVRIRWPMEPAFSSDGQKLAYVVSGPDEASDRVRYRLAILDRRTAQTAHVDSPDDVRSPQWNPGADQLACLAGGVVRVVRGTELVRLNASPRGARMFVWSPEGDLVLAVAEGWPSGMDMALREVAAIDDLRTLIQDEIWLVPIVGEEAQRVSIGPVAGIEQLAWSADGRSVAFTSRPGGQSLPAAVSAISVWDVDSGTVTELVPPDGMVKALAWNPEGTHIAYLGHRCGGSHSANLELYLVSVDGSETPYSISSDLDRSVGQVVRGDDERGAGSADLAWNETGIYAACAFGGSSAILRFDGAGGHDVIVGGDRAVLGFDVAPTTGEVAFTWSDELNPGELSLCEGDGADEKQVSDINGVWRAQVAGAATEALSVATSDGAIVHGWLTPPRSSDGPHPIVLQVHGGPHYPVGNRFSFDAQRLAAQGIAVLRANPRGSQGYGIEFASGIHGDWGGRDFADLQELLDAVTDRPEIDADRIAIVGESYGGFMVNWALGHDDRFAAGIAENAIAYVAGVATGLRGIDFWRYALGEEPHNAAGILSKTSPLFAAADISTPLLLIHAEEDSTVPIEQSEAMFVALKALGKDVRFFRIPGEQHWVNVFGTPSRRLERLRVFDEFLIERLLSKTTTENGVEL